MSEWTSVVDLLRARATERPEAILYRFLETGEIDGATTTWTVAHLDERARAVGAALQARCAPGERALLVYAPGLDFVAAFFGCLYAGVVAVPAYPPDPSRVAKTLPRLEHVARDCEASLVLSTAPIVQMGRFLAADSAVLRGMPWIATDTLPTDAAATWRETRPEADALAFLQYTSGSTHLPKGARISHHNILHNVGQVVGAARLGPGDDGCGWLPLFHDMGLMAYVVTPILVGAASTLMSPLAFLQRPMRWLEAYSHFKGRISAAPNFAFDLCARKATDDEVSALDLSGVHAMLNGAERIRPETVDAFLERFAPAGLRPEAMFFAYGLAETTVFVTGRFFDGRRLSCSRQGLERGVAEAPAASEPAIDLVSCGLPADNRLVVVDPVTRTPCAPGRVGEIWVSGPSVAGGYWRPRMEHADVFGAELPPPHGGGWLRTGDLGVLNADGLHVTGRLKDVIILRGRNHYPEDIERTAQSVPGVRPGGVAAFAVVDSAGRERCTIVAELGRGVEDLPGVAARVRAAVTTTHGIEPGEIVLVRGRAVPKTSSGKVRRRACRDQLAGGGLPILYQDAIAERGALPFPADGDAAAITRWLQARIGAMFGRAPERVDVHRAFADLGLDSLRATELAAELQAAVGRPLPEIELFSHPTIDALARYVAGEPVEEAPRRRRRGGRGGLLDALDAVEAAVDADNT